MASSISLNVSYIIVAFLPPILWLVFYLQEDRHPEPKRLLLLAFVSGMASAILAVFAEVAIFEGIFPASFQLEENVIVFFLVVGFVEEYVKYLAIKTSILRKADFDEPIDAMIYMMTAALGFAALENVFFLFPIFRESIPFGVEVTTNRFFGANLLHALSSGIVGFFLARAFFSPWRHHYIALGVIIATLLHALFNYLIIIKEVADTGIIYLTLLLLVMFSVVMMDFHRLRLRMIEAQKPIDPTFS